MNKKHFISFLVVIVFFIFTQKVSANLEITEVMYDPEGSDVNREWVKLYNNGNEEIKIISGKADSSWRIGDGESGETLHYISEDLNIKAGEYAVISKNKETFLLEYPFFSGGVASSSISLVNTSGVVKIFDGTNPRNVIAIKEYNAGDVPNIEENSQENSGVDDDSSSTSSTNSTSSSKKKYPKILEIETQIILPKIIVAGIPFELKSLTTTNRDQTFSIGKFIWNFGDGMSRESKNAEIFEYIYAYPGEYVLTLSFFNKYFNLKPEPEATDRVIVKVISPEIFITSVGGGDDLFVELENKSKSEIDISGWVLKGINNSFVLPHGMIILPSKKIKLSPKVTLFNSSDLSSVILSNQVGETIAIYPQKKTYSNVSKLNSNNINTIKKEESPSVINLNDLSANASNSNKNTVNSYYAWMGLLGVVIIGSISMVLMRRRKIYPDYIDKDIRAEDMSIIE